MYRHLIVISKTQNWLKFTLLVDINIIKHIVKLIYYIKKNNNFNLY